jgi:hypothetical protein
MGLILAKILYFTALEQIGDTCAARRLHICRAGGEIKYSILSFSQGSSILLWRFPLFFFVPQAHL